jgi:4-hydroxybenzoate polyprenyltransferase
MLTNFSFSKKLSAYTQLMRLNRPIGILLLLWPTLWALWIASKGHPDKLILGIFILGTILMRSAGCVINDIADRHFDGKVARTKNRPLATGEVNVKEALSIFFMLCFFALILVLFLNPLCLLLALFGVLVTIIYPFMKRYTHLPQLVLGLAFAWGVPMAFAAQTNTIPLIAWCLFVSALIWPIIYDTMYALTDKSDDLKIGIKSTAILFGQKNNLILGVLQILLATLLFFIGLNLALNFLFNIFLIIAISFMIYQQFLIKDYDPKNCFKAFLNNNWFGFAIFLGFFCSYLIDI